MGKIKFGTDGWRAVIAEDFTFENLGYVVEAISLHLKQSNRWQKGIFIGYDNRFLSDYFASHCSKILIKNGIRPYLPDTSVPTPAAAYMIKELDLDGALMITASHNPAKYSGIKFIPYYSGPAEDGITKEIEKNLETVITGSHKNIPGANNGSTFLAPVTVSDFSGYKTKLLELVDTSLIKEMRPRVTADAMFGSGGNIFREIINNGLGLDALFKNDYRDTLFGGKLPDPSRNNLANLKDMVLKNKMDIGLALDGDADRFGIIDGKGNYISPNNAIAIILYYLAENKRYETGDIAVRTIATTHLIDEIAASNNIGILETPVGFKYICNAMLKGNVVIGGEESGGLSIKGHIPEKDGLLADLLMLEIQAYLLKHQAGTYITDYLEGIYKKHGYFYSTRIDMEIPNDKKGKVIEFFMDLKGKTIDGNKVVSISDMDGARVTFANKSWVLVRASGTEPLIRCYIESMDKAYFDILQSFIKSSVKLIIE
jgi:phosphomannomutase